MAEEEVEVEVEEKLERIEGEDDSFEVFKLDFNSK